MATYVMFGKYSPDSLKQVSAKRTKQAQALIQKMGGEYKAAYAMLGEFDLMAIIELPDTERAMEVSASLTKLTGISFRTAPAVSAEAFDKLLG